MVQPRRNPSPTYALKVVVQPVHTPHVALQGAQKRRAVRKEVVTTEEKQGVPRILEWRLDRVHGIRPALSALAARFENLRPLGGPAAREGCKRMRVGTCDLACEFTLFQPRRVEILHVADS